ncbi:MAG: nucleoside-triphosphatase [Anaerolineae bacterium]
MTDTPAERGVAWPQERPQERTPEQVAAHVAALPPGARWLGILSGWRGAGKSTWCAALAEAARTRGLAVAGVLSRAVFADDRLPPAEREKTRIDLIDLATGAVSVLATPAEVGSENHGMRWHFDEATVAWGNAVLGGAGVADGVFAELVIIDELGPLELTHGRGLTAGLDLLDARRYRAAIAVIRPELLDAALARWPEAEVIGVPQWGGTQSGAQGQERNSHR